MNQNTYEKAKQIKDILKQKKNELDNVEKSIGNPNDPVFVNVEGQRFEIKRAMLQAEANKRRVALEKEIADLETEFSNL